MDYFYLVMFGVVLAYVGFHNIKTLRVIHRRTLLLSGGDTAEVNGVVVEKTDDKKRAANGVLLSLCFPKCKCEYGGQEYYSQSTVRYKDVNIGDSVAMYLCERTGEAWAITDLPIMKKKAITNCLIMLALIIVMCLDVVLF